MIEIAGQTQVKWLGTSALVVCVGYGLAVHSSAGIEQANAQMLMEPSTPNIGTVCQDSSYSLDELVECISEHMPAKSSGAYVVPDAGIQSDWRTLVQDLVAIDDISDCDAISVPSSLDAIYDVFPFYDAFDDREYCVAMEVEDADENQVVDRGWGTLIVNPTPERYLSIDIPHPLEDNYTNMEGIAIFKGVGAHTFVMAGANRQANSTESTCQSGEKQSDVAHSIANLFFPTVVEIDQHHLQHTAIQFHGMSSDGCPNVAIYITHGSKADPKVGDSIIALKQALLTLKPEWDGPGVQTVANPGESEATCSKNGTDNVEGRYLNTGSESVVCGNDVGTYNGSFIHIEQDPDNSLTEYRNPMTWIAALESVFPPLSSQPATTTISFQDGVSPDSGYHTFDTWIDEGDPDDLGDSDKTEDDGDNAVAVKCEADDDKGVALYWDVSDIPANSTIDEVTITLNVLNTTDRRGYYAYELTQEWTEAATWNHYAPGQAWQVSGAKGALDRSAIPVGKWTPLEKGKHSFSINPTLVQSWLDDPGTNHGILIANEDNKNGVDFSCREASADKRPKLTVVYH